MTQRPTPCLRSALGAAALLALCTTAQAAVVDVTVTVQNLAPVNSISFAPLHVGFNNGSFDAFNLGGAPTEPIISVAEGGAGGAWQAAFAAADPTATRGTIGGLLQPGEMSSLTFRVNTMKNAFFTFASMVVPSNDFFIGNDNPTEYRLFNAAGGLSMASIGIKSNEIWDAGSEVFDPAAAAFFGNNGLRREQNSVVAFNFAELAAFNGLTTGAGYTFNSALTADSDVYRIGFAVSAVPEPGSYALMAAGLLGIGVVARRRRGEQQKAGSPRA
jgi:hypothetical protein